MCIRDSPGDLVIADEEGIIVLDPASAEAAIEGGHEVKAAEQRVLDRLCLLYTSRCV